MAEILMRGTELSKTYSSGGVMQHVLRSLDIELRTGDFTIIMGASGAGKSTLLYVLAGMEKPTLGSVWFKDKDLSDFTTDQMAVFRRTHCGFVFQQNQLLHSMTILDNILCAGLLCSNDRRALEERIRALFSEVQLDDDLLSRFPAQISGGEAQRAGIVRALINAPDLLFADEPTAALNSQTGIDVLDTLTHCNRSGQTIVMVTHDMRCARRGNRILYLRDGSFTGECDLGPYEHADRRRHERLLAFLSEMGW